MMNSRKGDDGIGNPSRAAPSPKGKSMSSGTTDLHVSNLNLNSEKEDGWEVYIKKSKNKGSSEQSGSGSRQYGSSKPWAHTDTSSAQNRSSHGGGLGRGLGQPKNISALSADPRKPAGRGYNNNNNKQPLSSYRASDTNYVAGSPAIPPPLKNAWGGWSSRNTTSTHFSEDNPNNVQDKAPTIPHDDDDDDDDDDDESDGIDESDDELISDDFESDGSQKSHETKKKNRWFKELFACLDGLTIDQINEPERQWHCPACKGGPGAIDWYRGLQPLITHAKTIRSKRVKLHRELAQLLDEELQRRGTSAVPAGEVFGKWKGLAERTDNEIVWPPMVVIMNTRLDKDDNEKWIGMGNQELLDYFSSYSAVKARHSYGPQGHRGISVLIFEASAVGYTEAERLGKHFEDTCRDRYAWDKLYKMQFCPGGKRQLYGFMANKQDMDNFNQHAQGKTKLKYEMKSYQEMVVKQMKQMSEDNQQLLYFKNKVAKEQKSKKAMAESLGMITERLRKTTEENRIVKLRTKKHHEQNKEQMDYQENFYKEKIQQYFDDRNKKEENFEKIQQDQREKLSQTEENLSSAEERARRAEEIAKSIQLQDKDIEEFTNERDNLVKAFNERRLDMKRRHFEEELNLEKQFDAAFNLLLEKYKPSLDENVK